MPGMLGISRAVGLFLGIVAAVPSMAGSARLDGSVVYVNDLPVLSFRTGTPSVRAKPLLLALAAHDGKANARSSSKGGRHVVVLGNRTVVRIEPEDARLAAIPPAELARTWSANLNRALSLPPIVLGSTSVQIGNGAEHRLALFGTSAHLATVESSDESIVRAKRVPGYLVLKGNLSGSTQVAVTAGGQTYVLAVKVVPSAAVFPQYASIQVTGVPATGSTTTGAVSAAIYSQLKTAPSAEIKFQVAEVGQLPPGEARTIPVRVTAVAPDAVSTEGIVYVTVRNVPRVVEPESELWYDNVPESIERVGQLFGGKISTKEPVRILYHHDNDSPRGLLFHSQILNASNRPAQILLIPGDSPTDANPVLAGVEAADRFFRNWLSSSGEIVTIPPGASLPIAMRRLAPKQTVSGLIYVALLPGGPDNVFVRSDAKLPFLAEGRWATALASNFPWRVLGPQPIRGEEGNGSLLSEHVFPQPFRNLAVSYAVGGRHGFVRIGQEPIPSVSGDRYLDGNFGVVYTIRALVENPTATAAEIEMVYEASAGYASALFAVNGQVVNGPMLKPKGEARILKMRLEAGATRQFTVQTIPHSGGSYPATLAIRPIETASYSRAQAVKSSKSR